MGTAILGPIERFLYKTSVEMGRAWYGIFVSMELGIYIVQDFCRFNLANFALYIFDLDLDYYFQTFS